MSLIECQENCCSGKDYWGHMRSSDATSLLDLDLKQEFLWHSWNNFKWKCIHFSQGLIMILIWVGFIFSNCEDMTF